MVPDARRIDELYVSLGSDLAISKKLFARRLTQAFSDYFRLSSEEADDTEADPLLHKLHLIAGHAAKIHKIASELELPKRKKLYGTRLAVIPDEALELLSRIASAFVDQMAQPKSPRWQRRKKVKAANHLLQDLGELWTQTTRLKVTFTTNPTTNERTGRFLTFYWDATRGVPGLPTKGTTIKSRFMRLEQKSHRRGKKI